MNTWIGILTPRFAATASSGSFVIIAKSNGMAGNRARHLGSAAIIAMVRFQIAGVMRQYLSIRETLLKKRFGHKQNHLIAAGILRPAPVSVMMDGFASEVTPQPQSKNGCSALRAESFAQHSKIT